MWLTGLKKDYNGTQKDYKRIWIRVGGGQTLVRYRLSRKNVSGGKKHESEIYPVS